MSEATATAVLFDALGTLFAVTPPHSVFGHAMTALGYTVGEDDAERLVARANDWQLDPAREPVIALTAGVLLDRDVRFPEWAGRSILGPEELPVVAVAE